MSSVSLFLSCVSHEFGTYRDALRRDLTRPNLTTAIQEDFIAHSGPTLQKLDEYIKHCDAVIHLCGDMTGSAANASSLAYIRETYPDLATVFPELKPMIDGAEEMSYTQWEAWLALYHKKILLIAAPEKEMPRSAAYKQDLEQLKQQERHLARLKAQGKYVEIRFSTADGLIKEVYRSSLLELLTKVPAVKPNTLPYHSIGSLFKGREEVLQKLHEELQVNPSGNAAIVGKTLHGLGGIGKTRLAVEYGWRYREHYSALLFVVADAPGKLMTNLAALSAPSALRLPEYEVPEEERRYEAVIGWFNQNPGWLLILDNADTAESAAAVEDLFERLRGGHVLITSRVTSWSPQVSQLKLDTLTEDAATAFLLERTEAARRKGADDDALARQIANLLGCLALALEQAGAYISTRKQTMKQYLHDWEAQHQKVLEWKNERLTNYPHSVAVTWQTTVERLSSPARTLLYRLAWLAPEPVPESLLDVPVPEEETSDWTAALVELSDYSLVDRNDDLPEFTVHRLVQDVTRTNQREDEADNTRAACVHWIKGAFSGEPSDVRDWPLLEPLVPHALSLLFYSSSLQEVKNVISFLSNQLGVFYLTKAQYHAAEPLMRKALQIDEESFGQNHPNVAIRLNNLAQLLKATNRLSEAEPLMRKALQIDEESFGENHPNVAIDLNNLAGLLQATNRLYEAEPLMRRALRIDEESFGENHPRVAVDLNNLAQLLKATNRLSEAEPLMRKALQIDEESFGENHPNVAIDLNNLAQLLKATNRLYEAEPLMRRALRIDEESFGENHPRVAVDLNNLAQLLKATNRLSEAEPLMRRALRIDEESFGQNHPNVAIRLNNLAGLLQATNRLSEAEPLMRKALRIDEESFGENHPNVARNLNNLAGLLQATNRLSEAEPLMRRAFIIFLVSLGFNHPNTQTVGNNYILLLRDIGKTDEEIKTILSKLMNG